MTATPEDVLADLASRALVEGIRQTFDLAPASIGPIVPCAVVEPDDGDFLLYDPAMSSQAVDYLMSITVYVSGTDDKAAQTQLFAFLRPSGPSSIRAAVAGSNPSLGVSYAVLRASKPQMVAGDGDTKYLSSTIGVRVTA